EHSAGRARQDRRLRRGVPFLPGEAQAHLHRSLTGRRCRYAAQMAAALHVTRVRTYPVKSLAGNDVERAAVEPWGLADDRRWGLVDESGAKVTARTVRHL